MTDAAPGKYDGDKQDPRRKPLDGLLASIVVTSTKYSVLPKLKSRSILYAVRVLNH